MEKKNLFGDFPPSTVSQWEEKIREDLKGADYDKKLVWNSPEGIRIRPYYTATDLKGSGAGDQLPGCYPYVRGHEPGPRPWIINQEIEVKDAADANRIALEAIAGGAEALTFRIRQLSYREEMQALLRDLDVEKIHLHFASSFSYSILAELLSDELQRKKSDVSKVHGSFSFDSIAWYILHGEFYNSREDNFNEAAALIRLAEKQFPEFRIITINGQHFHNAGGHSVQELAFSLASASEYLSALDELGISPGLTAAKCMLRLSVGSDYFMEIAKLRAARMLWSMLMDAYSINDDKARKIRISSVSSLWNKTVYDPWVNQLRLTTEGMSAAIGGSHEICLQPYSKVFRDADPVGDRLSRNIQHLLREESYMDAVADPAAGSYYIESLTLSLAQQAWALFLEVESKGGLIEYTAAGHLKEQIAASCQKRDMDIAMRKTSVLGTNIFPNAAEQMLTELQHTSAPFYSGLRLYRGAEAFEEVRLATEKFASAEGKRPEVQLLSFGNLAMRKARATFASNFFACAGYHIREEKEYTGSDQLIQKTAGADIVVLCSSDEEYTGAASEIAACLKADTKPPVLIVAGNPPAAEELINAGVDDFIHIRTNLLETLGKYQKLFGIL